MKITRCDWLTRPQGAGPAPRPGHMTLGEEEEADRSNMAGSPAALLLLLCGLRVSVSGLAAPRLLGLRLEGPAGPVDMAQRLLSAPDGARFQLRLFGTGLNGSWPWVGFAGSEGSEEDPDPCLDPTRRNGSAFQVSGEPDRDKDDSLLLEVHVRLGSGSEPNLRYRVCLRSGESWSTAGPDRLQVRARNPELPAWGLALLVVLLLGLSSVLRTVNLSLLWLDPVELYVLHSCGSEEEKRAAKRLEPVRRRGNFLVSVPNQNQDQGLTGSAVQQGNELENK